MTFIHLLMLFYLCYLPTLNNTNSNDVSLQLEITNIQKAKGYINIAVSSGTENFLKDDKILVAQRVPVKKIGLIQIHLDNLPRGEYAIALFHDINDNNKLDTNFLGVPNEPYGFSNNARSKWGPAKYEEAKFQLNKKQQKMVIVLKKWRKQ